MEISEQEATLPDVQEEQTKGDKDKLNLAVTTTLEDFCLDELKHGLPMENIKLSIPVIESIVSNVERGVPLSVCAMYLGLSAVTVGNWFRKGQKEIEGISAEDWENCDGDYSKILSVYGLFYMKVCKARATPIINLQDCLYERAFEAGKEWIATYMLERMLPETYNLKYKIQQDVSANVSANVVEFKFVDGPKSRSIEDQEFINQQIEDLKEKYSTNDIIDVTPVTDSEGEGE